MSSSTPVNASEAYLERITRLHDAASESQFFSQLDSLLRSVLNRADFTLVAPRDSVMRVIYSSHFDGLRRRLNSPTIDMEQLEAALEVLPRELHAPAEEAAELTIDGIDIPLHRAWQLGNREDDKAYLLFHDERDRYWECPIDAIKELHRNISVAFYKLADRGRLHEETDLLRAKLEAINEIGELLGSLDLEVLLTKLLELSLYVVNGQVGSIILVREEEDGSSSIECPIEWGLPLELARCFQDGQNRAIFESVITTGEAITALDFLSSGCAYHVEGADVHVDSYLCIPLISKSHVLGAVNLVNSASTEIDREVLMTICGLAATSIENAMLYEVLLEKERYQESLKIARDIQRKLYPSQAPEISWLEFASRTESCDETGGDYYDYFVPAGTAGDLTMVIGDVSGHGIGAALHMVAARSGLRATWAQEVDLVDMLTCINDQLEQDMEVEHFMTLFIANLSRSRSLSYVNAGHDAPCVFRAQTGAVETLGSTGIPLGLFPGHPYKVGEVPGLQTGDVFLAMTDGVWEVNNPQGKMLGKEPIVETFGRLCRENDSADAIASAILAEVGEYTGGSPARDDVTLVVIRAR